MKSENFVVSPIGQIQADVKGFYLKLQGNMIPGLKGLDGFSHVIVLWWCHYVDNAECRQIVVCEQPYKGAPDKMGVFATRLPVRPNPIALDLVQVIKIDYQRGIIRIPYIEAEAGSPILDLKPYHPSTDRLKQVSVPCWCSHWPQWYEEAADFDWEAEFINAREVSCAFGTFCLLSKGRVLSYHPISNRRFINIMDWTEVYGRITASVFYYYNLHKDLSEKVV